MAKRYLITGATSGIGAAVYQTLHAQGHELWVVLRNTERANDLPQPPAGIVVANLADPAACEQAFANWQQPLDGVIYAAGILAGQSLTEMPLTVLQQTMQVNLIAPMQLLKAVWPQLQPAACVVLFGSISGHKGSYDDAYAASKAGLHGLVRSLALKLAPKGRVVGIAPGMTEHTGMTYNLIPGRFAQTRDTLIPLKQAGQPDDLAALVSFILSDQACFMTGSIVDVNGGQYLRT